jgi:hypothetical protein
MKKPIITYELLIAFILMAFVSCQQQSLRSEFEENMAEIKLEMQDLVEEIEEVKEEADMSVFISKTDALLNKLDDQIEEYHNEMDRALQKIEKETRHSIISIKQKMVEIDFRLALLDENETIRRRIRPTVYPYTQPVPVDPIEPELDEPQKVHYGTEVKKEIINNLNELRSEVEDFIASWEY